ncbi:Na+/H+ antiporter NhaC family protein [Shewanella sp. GutDb-MelDb]|uniref:Na+/H+ antiporter NhaC family protein n=1 Tax=Shewanella sp. GutDb-MelDb TaxID=2058316 RepID=UPI000C7DFC17|nr:Na+/H+ antiporter NhaC family protein [Shewanella sp. GutDb-MelDb]PKG56762.1 sodium:proton antiporter [Shewanella sp. GutDb-MelDb]
MLGNILMLTPLVLTLVLALVLQRTLVALGVGIISGALIISAFNPVNTTVYLSSKAWMQFYADGQWQAWHLNVLAAMVLLGMMTQLLARGGAVKSFADWLYHRIKSGRQARVGVVVLGWVVFIDGIFSCLAVGHVCQPLSQRYSMSKEQIAYLVDSNASPLCALLPFSSWGPYVMAILASITLLPLSPLESFIEIAKLNFYAITVIILSLLVAWFGIGFTYTATTEPESAEVEAGNPWLLGIPMASLLIASVALTLWSGASNSQSADISQWITSADIGAAMRDACILAMTIAVFMLKLSGRKAQELVVDMFAGMKVISFAISILLFTWMIGAVIADLGVAKLLASWAEQFISSNMLVAGTFILCAVMAFTTGSSWGTFAIMIPIGAEIAVAVDSTLMLPVLSAVMAGSVFGDHCSPISDTSVISATSSGCEPHAHVVTQLPFALIAAFSALLGFQLINLKVDPIWSWCIVLLAALLLLALYHRGTRGSQVEVAKAQS